MKCNATQRESAEKLQSWFPQCVPLLYPFVSQPAADSTPVGAAVNVMTLGGDHLPALVGWYAASVGNNYATPSLLQFLGDRPLPLNVLEQAML